MTDDSEITTESIYAVKYNANKKRRKKVLGMGGVWREIRGSVEFKRYAEEKEQGFAGGGAAAAAGDVRPERGFGPGAG
jgi:hypothetical protein